MTNSIELASKIEDILKSRFPNGYARVRYSENLTKHISVGFGLIGDIDDVTNKIRGNDPLHHSFIIFVEGEDKYEANRSSGSLMTVPPADSYLAMGRIKTPFRKTTGDEKKVLKAFERFADRAAKLVKDNEGDIYGVSKIPSKYLAI